MKQVLILSFFIFFVASQDTDSVEIKLKWREGSKISSGFTSGRSQFPFVALMLVKMGEMGRMCTGTLISNRWLVGAKSCLILGQTVESVKSIEITLGSVSRYSGVSYFAKRIIYRPNADFALYETVDEVKMNSNIQAIRLPSTAQANLRFEGSVGFFIGFGQVQLDQYSSYLQYANLIVVGQSECDLDGVGKRSEN